MPCCIFPYRKYVFAIEAFQCDGSNFHIGIYFLPNFIMYWFFLRLFQVMISDKADEVVLETEITNKPALRLYENLGFVRDKRLFRYYLNGVDALRLKLWLRWNYSNFLKIVSFSSILSYFFYKCNVYNKTLLQLTANNFFVVRRFYLINYEA